MNGSDHSQEVVDPVERMRDLLARTWSEMCRLYEVNASLPDLSSVFHQVDLSDTCVAAEKIVVNLLLEIMECIGRFSPFYRQPPRAFGVTSYRNPKTQQVEWILAPEGQRRWETTLARLEGLLVQYGGIVRAVILVEGLMARSAPGDPQVIAHCRCTPPHTIQLRRSLVQTQEIICECCKRPYEIAETQVG
ncbi:MAG: hypothetical protein RML93_00050 [Anaerolineales bacterium]|nr:hypothetical protein [Anaerolineales bacterium]MDW8445661.1 hypothetical protein [Anaerolineales bacterium]